MSEESLGSSNSNFDFFSDSSPEGETETDIVDVFDKDIPAKKEVGEYKGEKVKSIGENEDEDEDDERIEKASAEGKRTDAKKPSESLEKKDDERIEEEQADDTPKKKEKAVEFKHDNGKVKIDPYATVKLSVDGETKDVTFAELRDSYASREARRREFQEIKAKEREVIEVAKKAEYRAEEADAKEAAMEEIVTNFAKEVKSGNVIAGLGRMLHAVGEEPLTVIRTIRNQLLQYAQDYLILTPEQRQMIDAQEEAEYYKWKLSLRQEAEKHIANHQKIQQTISKVMSSYQIPDLDTYKRLEKDLRKMQTEGQIKLAGNAPSPEEVGEYHAFMQRKDLVNSAVIEVDKSLLNDAEVLKKLHRMVREFNPSKEELIMAIRHYIGSDSPTSANTSGKKLSFKPKGAKSSPNKQKIADLFF